MSGTRTGGLITKNKVLSVNPNHYKEIGARGGKLGKTGGFGQGDVGRERASLWGSLGGRLGSRGGRKLSARERARRRKEFEQTYEYLLLVQKKAQERREMQGSIE